MFCQSKRFVSTRNEPKDKFSISSIDSFRQEKLAIESKSVILTETMFVNNRCSEEALQPVCWQQYGEGKRIKRVAEMHFFLWFYVNEKMPPTRCGTTRRKWWFYSVATA